MPSNNCSWLSWPCQQSSYGARQQKRGKGPAGIPKNAVNLNSHIPGMDKVLVSAMTSLAAMIISFKYLYLSFSSGICLHILKSVVNQTAGKFRRWTVLICVNMLAACHATAHYGLLQQKVQSNEVVYRIHLGTHKQKAQLAKAAPTTHT